MHKQQRLRLKTLRFSLRGCFPLYLAACMAWGCSSVPDNTVPDDPGGGGDSAATARIDNILSNASVSIDDPAITILFTATGSTGSIRGVIVPVADNSVDAQPIGPVEVVAQNLIRTENEAFFSFFPDGAGVGFFRVGIEVPTDEGVIEAFSDGVIQVQGRPDPCFTQPCDPASSGQTLDGCGGLVCDRFHDVTVGDQDGVNISFDAGDPEGVVAWRLFYLRETDGTGNPADQLGVEILVGSGNLGLVAFVTLELVVGDYELGISATDSGMSVAETVEFDGNDDRIVTVFGPVVRVVP